MKLLQNFLSRMIPESRLSPALVSEWRKSNFSSFFKLALIGLIGISIGHILHNIFIDRPLELHPPERWFFYRLSMAGLALSTAFIVYQLSKQKKQGWALISYCIWGLVQSHFQARTMSWSPLVPYAFSILIPCLICIVARLSPLLSLFYLSLLYLSGISYWDPASNNNMVFSAAIVGFVVVLMFRYRMNSEIDLFVSNIEKIEAKEKLISFQIKINEQTRAFLPSVIYKRFNSLINSGKLSSNEAMSEVIKIRKCPVTCTYSDIRGFTQLSKNDNQNLLKRVIPEIQQSCEIVEKHNGVPRVVGDLIFAYHDTNPEESIIEGVLSCFELHRTNRDLSDGNKSILKRHYIVSHGEALVGNIGGEKNSREITVMGSPANVLSRIDQITKKKQFKKFIDARECILLTPDAASLLRQAVPRLHISSIDLKKQELNVKDYPELAEIYSISMTLENKETLSSALSKIQNKDLKKCLKIA